MYQQTVMVPIGGWANTRLKNLSEVDRRRDPSAVGSGFGKTIANWIGREVVYPSNVLHLATECGNKNHSAVFPEALPEWFVNLFSKPGDTVLDPFLGSGTTAVVAHRLGRNAIGIEILPEYLDEARRRLQHVRPDVARRAPTRKYATK